MVSGDAVCEHVVVLEVAEEKVVEEVDEELVDFTTGRILAPGFAQSADSMTLLLRQEPLLSGLVAIVTGELIKDSSKTVLRPTLFSGGFTNFVQN